MHSKIHIQNSTDQKHIFGNNIFEKHKNKKMFYISLPTCQNVIHFGKFLSEIKIFVQSLFMMFYFFKDELVPRKQKQNP